MKPIGGYFEWEFPTTHNADLHENSVYLNSGRHALEYILKGIGKVRRLWIPYFTCEVVLQPLDNLGIPYKFYNIDDKLEIANEINLNEGEYLLYTNYYGIKDVYCNIIAERYGHRAIIDNAQGLFCKPNPKAHQFYSPRKYIGVPDGGIAVTSLPDTTDSLPKSTSYSRCMHLLKRMELTPSEGYDDFKINDNEIDKSHLSRMSNISKRILETVDLDFIKLHRRENFAYLHKSLASTNRLEIPTMDNFECPLVYPYWSDKTDLKKKLIANNIFVATYWPNVLEWCKPCELEYELANHIACIPIDQRYSKEDMDRIVKTIQNID